MQFWSTCETSDDVTEMPELVLTLEDHLKRHLTQAALETSFSKWAVIYYCVRSEFAEFFSETYVARKKPERTMEFRLEICHKDFVAADTIGKMALLLSALRRSIGKMQHPKFKVSAEDQTAIGKIIDDIGKELLT